MFTRYDAELERSVASFTKLSTTSAGAMFRIEAVRALKSVLAGTLLLTLHVATADVFESTAEDGSSVYSDYPKDERSSRIRSVGSSSAAKESQGTLRQLAAELAGKHGVDPSLVLGIIHVESGFDTRAVSPAGARGLMQLMPDTAARYGAGNPHDARQNIEAGVRYLRALLDRYDGNVVLALSAYNSGPASVRKYDQRIPPYEETMLYVPAVLAAADVFRKSE